MTRKKDNSDTGSAPLLPDSVSMYAAPEVVTLYAAPTTGGWDSGWEYTRTGSELFHILPSDGDIKGIKEDVVEMKKVLQEILERLKRLEEKNE